MSSPSPSPSLSLLLVACVLVSRSRSRYPYEKIIPFFSSFTGVCNRHSELPKRVRARVWWKEVSGKLPTWGIGESRAAKVRECADRSTTPLFRSRSTDRLLYRYSCVVNKICPSLSIKSLKLLNREEGREYCRASFIHQD